MNRCILMFLAIIGIASCRNLPEYYHGFVYSEATRKPIAGIKVAGEFDKEMFTFTDEKGYFKIMNTKKGMEINFILSDANQVLDTLQTFWIQHSETEMRAFVASRNDTIFINYGE